MSIGLKGGLRSKSEAHAEARKVRDKYGLTGWKTTAYKIRWIADYEWQLTSPRGAFVVRKDFNVWDRSKRFRVYLLQDDRSSRTGTDPRALLAELVDAAETDHHRQVLHMQRLYAEAKKVGL